MAGETIDDMIDATMTADNKLRASDTCLTGLKSYRVRVDRRKASRSADLGER